MSASIRSPLLPLRAAIRAACLADASLAALMQGPATILDEPPRGGRAVYAVFDDATLRDLSTSSGRAHEQEVAIAVWAEPGSAAGAIAAADRIAALLDDAPLALAGHRLVGLAVTGIDVRRDPNSRQVTATLRLRAATEVLG